MSRVTGKMAAGLITGIMLAWCARLPAQVPPLSYAAIIGGSDFANSQIAKIPAAESSASAIAAALKNDGLPTGNIIQRSGKNADNGSVRFALQSALKSRANDKVSVLVFLAGKAEVDVIGGAREAFFMSYGANPGAKRATAFPLSDLIQLIQGSGAGGIYLILDLTGDPVPELNALGRMPHVVMSAIATGSNAALPLAAAAAHAFEGGPNALSIGRVADVLKSHGVQTSAAPAQLAALVFPIVPPPPPQKEPDKTEPIPPIAKTPEVPTRSSLNNAIGAARALLAANNCKGAFDTLASIAEPDPDVSFLRSRADACSSRQTALARFAALQISNTSVDDLHQSLVQAQAALRKNPGDAELGSAVAELTLREQYAAALSKLAKDPDAAQQGFDGFIKAANVSPMAIRIRLQPLTVQAAKKSQEAGVKSTLKRGRQLYALGQNDAARELFEKIRDKDPEAAVLLNQIGDKVLQSSLQAALRQGKEALARQDWSSAVNQYNAALSISPGNEDATTGRKNALANIEAEKAAATDKANKFKILLGVAAVGLVLLGLALYVAIKPKRRADFLFRTGRQVAAARLYARNGDYKRALQICQSRTILNPEDNEIRRVAGEIYFAAREESSAADAYLELMRRGYGDEAMYEQVLEMVSHLDSLGLSTSRREVENVIAGASELHPQSGALHASLAKLYSAENRIDSLALEVYGKAIVVDQRNRDLPRLLARGEYESKRYDRAFPWARQALTANAADPETLSVLIESGDELGTLPEALELLRDLPLDAVHALSAYEQVAEKAPQLRERVQSLYHEKLNQVDGNLRDRRLVEAHIAIGEERFREAEALLKSAASDGDLVPIRGLLAGAYRRILANDRSAPGELSLELARLYGSAGDVTAAAELLRPAILMPETQRAATSLLEEIYDAVPVDQLAPLLFRAAGWTIRQTAAGLLASAPDGAEHAELDNCLVATFKDPVRVAEADNVRSLIVNRNAAMNHRFAFLMAPIRPRHEVYAFLYSLPSDEQPVWIVPLDASIVRKALVRGDASTFLERELDLWRGRVDLYMDRDAITDPVRFFGRERYFSELTRRIASHENFGIFGIRKIGKTSLAGQLRRNLRNDLVGFADTQLSSSRVEEMYFLLVESLADDARRKFPEAALSPLRLIGYEARNDYPHVIADFVRDVSQILKDVRAMGPNPHALLIIDEVELLVPYRNSPGKPGYEDFFRTLRGLHQTNDHISSAIMGADPSPFRAAIWGERDNPVFQFYEEIFLTGFEKAECDSMLEGIGRLMGLEYTPESLAIVYQETGGHPFIARQLASSLANSFPGRPLLVEPASVETAIDDYLAVKGDYFEGIFKGNSLSPAALGLLTEGAAFSTETVGRADFASFASSRGIQHMELDKALQDLELFGLLLRERQTYSFRIQLLRRWIRRSWLGME